MNGSNCRRETQQSDGSRRWPMAEEQRQFREDIREPVERIQHLEGEYRNMGGLHD